MYVLYSADACPFAHRVRALLTHLDVPFELREIDLEDRDPAFLALSPTGRVPLLVAGDAVLYESAVVLEYLAEAHGFGGAFATDAMVRARQRLAAKQWDDVVLSAFYASLGSGGELADERVDRLARELGEIEATAIRSEPGSLLGFTLAPHWMRMDWVRDLGPVPALVDAHAELREWLAAAVALPAVEATAPDRETVVARYRARAS